MINIVFIRHGLTELSGKGYISSDKDTPLTKKGIEECKKNRYRDGEFDKVYCSPCKRATETAKLIYPYMDSIKTELITQRNWGFLKNHFKSEYEPDYIDKVRKYEIIPEGGESIDDIKSRLNKFIEKVCFENDDNSKVLVITHNGILRAIKRIYLNDKNPDRTSHLNGFSIEVNKN